MLICRKKKKRFNIVRGVREIDGLIDTLPDDDKCFKFLSFGGFSSASFIGYIANKIKINKLYVSTFRVGKKEIQFLHYLHNEGLLDYAEFVIFSLAKESDTHNYYKTLDDICRKNGWSIKILKNHSKVLLFETKKGKYVLETSSNLNENPKIEQFSFEKDCELFDFYKKNIFDYTDSE